MNHQNGFIKLVILAALAAALGTAAYFVVTKKSPAPPKLLTSLSLTKCLPVDTKLNDVVDEKKNVTVRQVLTNLGAQCTSALKLVDRTGKEITFFRLTGCWGNPPANYQSILYQQNLRIVELKKHYAVVLMTCNPTRGPIL